MRIVYAIITAVGAALVAWACGVNPKGAESSCDDQRHWPLVTKAPYSLMKHPMYVGNWLFIVGLAGLAAGIWNCLAIGTLAELLMRDWVRREQR